MKRFEIIVILVLALSGSLFAQGKPTVGGISLGMSRGLVESKLLPLYPYCTSIDGSVFFYERASIAGGLAGPRLQFSRNQVSQVIANPLEYQGSTFRFGDEVRHFLELFGQPDHTFSSGPCSFLSYHSFHLTLRIATEQETISNFRLDTDDIDTPF